MIPINEIITAVADGTRFWGGADGTRMRINERNNDESRT